MKNNKYLVPQKVRTALYQKLKHLSQGFNIRREPNPNPLEKDTILVVKYPFCTLTDSDIPSEFQGYKVKVINLDTPFCVKWD